ncbi:MAG: putative selenium-dependent hydroxylase accessory protein YqeC [Acidobacteria bacterium]|nr:putative selenium-dependent hydroxylase accessory protein YqeC [Acidobacteriota bacterium]MBI3657747.1 putative selenium-dependent hydroxylase accessory protein YqeC [Acidobacteriota bacterium]
MTLWEAFQLRPDDVAALVGGGGKTSLMFALAKAAPPHYTVITTTTTKIFVPSSTESAITLVDSDEAALEGRWLAIRERCRQATLARGLREDKNKLVGVRPEFVDRLAQVRAADLMIVEADGAKGRSLKAPSEGEPVVPSSTSVLVAVVGIDAIGLPFNEAAVFRAERAREIVGEPPGNVITEDWAAKLLTHAKGICQGAPAHARMVFFINKVENPTRRALAEKLASHIRTRSSRPIEAVVAGRLHSPAKAVEEAAWLRW